MAKAKEETALMKIEERFPVLAGDSKIAELIRINTGGQGYTISDLDAISVPTGGGVFWQVPSLSGAKSVETLDGCILYKAPQRAYWKSQVISNTRPDCSSSNMITGFGDPGGACKDCPWYQFESAVRPDGSAGAGKACKESIRLFFLREGAVLPNVVGIPAASLKPWKKFMRQIGERELDYRQCILKLRLIEKPNSDGTKYSQVQGELVAGMSLDELDKMREFAISLGEVFGQGGA